MGNAHEANETRGVAPHDTEHAEFPQAKTVFTEDEVSKPKLDEFGAHAKVDPAEIALVRKLDLWMMVSLVF